MTSVASAGIDSVEASGFPSYQFSHTGPGAVEIEHENTAKLLFTTDERLKSVDLLAEKMRRALRQETWCGNDLAVDVIDVEECLLEEVDNDSERSHFTKSLKDGR